MATKNTPSNSKTNISYLQPKFTLDQIKFNVDPATFKRAIKLYESNAIKEYMTIGLSYSFVAMIAILSTPPLCAIGLPIVTDLLYWSTVMLEPKYTSFEVFGRGASAQADINKIVIIEKATFIRLIMYPLILYSWQQEHYIKFLPDFVKQ